MEIQHINIKLFVEGDLPVDPVQFIDVFHRWIREGVCDELLIDVADYRHVPNGPGVMLIGHEADYSIDHAGGRWGLLYNRKAPLEGTNADRFRQAFSAAGKACQMLEDQFSGDGLTFNRQEVELTVNDRALAPNTAETLAACQPELQSFFAAALGHDDFTIGHGAADPRKRFAVSIRSAQPFEAALS